MTVFETWERFEDFLLHGYLDHHPDPAAATIDTLTEDQKQAFNLLKQQFEDTWYT